MSWDHKNRMISALYVRRRAQFASAGDGPSTHCGFVGEADAMPSRQDRARRVVGVEPTQFPDVRRPPP
jgi:hypothetical protein